MQLTPEVVLSCAAAVAVLIAAVWILRSRFRRKGDPEARRRAMIDAGGRIIEGTVTDYRNDVVYYSWSWRGVTYESSQDVSTLTSRLPLHDAIIGPVSVKFLSKVPSNSIVVSEKWNGFSTSRSPQS